MIPTPRLWLLLAIGIPVIALAVAAGVPYVAWIYNLLVFGLAWLTYRFAPDHKKIRVFRGTDPVLSVRMSNRIGLKLLNDGPVPMTLLVRDEPPPDFAVLGNERRFTLRPGIEDELIYSAIPFERGGDFFRGTYVRIACPLGLVWKEAKLRTETPIRVYPNVLALKEFDLLKQRGRLRQIGLRRSRVRGLGSEFESLREYAEGDDFRKIDWRATARRDTLIVRQYEQERNQSVLIVIDIGRRMLDEVDGVSKLDRALDACILLTHAAIVAGDLVGLLVYSDVVQRYIPPKKGRNQMGIILEALHDLAAEPVESNPLNAMSYLGARYKRRSLLVAFTDTDSPESAKKLAHSFGPLARRHLTVIARVRDPKLGKLYDQPLTGPQQFYERAAAAMLMDERRSATTIFDSAGLQTLEAEPDELSVALANFYFVVKERSLL